MIVTFSCCRLQGKASKGFQARAYGAQHAFRTQQRNSSSDIGDETPASHHSVISSGVHHLPSAPQHSWRILSTNTLPLLNSWPKGLPVSCASLHSCDPFCSLLENIPGWARAGGLALVCHVPRGIAKSFRMQRTGMLNRWCSQHGG